MTALAPWKSAAAEAHESKSEAFENAAVVVRSVMEAASPLTFHTLEQAAQALDAERSSHERAAALLRAEAA